MNYEIKRCSVYSFYTVDLKEKNAMKKIMRTVKKTIADMAKKSAGMEANNACSCMNYQMEETQAVKKLRKY